MGFKRLKEDERALVFNRHGTGTVISGPTRVSCSVASSVAAPKVKLIVRPLLCETVLLETTLEV